MPGRDLLAIASAIAIERRNPAVLLESIRIGGGLDESALAKPRALAGLGLEPRVEIARVLAHLRRGLRRRAERDDEPRRVPRGARCQAIALDQDHVGPAHVREVICDGTSDHTAADHDGACGCRYGHARTQDTARPGRLAPWRR